jgi:uncharacterized protein (TIGR02145 family)
MASSIEKIKEAFNHFNMIYIFLFTVVSFAQQKEAFTDLRDGKTYKIVKIGNQTWMAENLNYATKNSKCYDHKSANCNIYGRLYDWATAMALDSSCNFNFCSEQIQAQHKGICPSGWHIPSKAEGKDLIDYVDRLYIAKAKGLTNYYDVRKAKTIDDYGFSTLRGGLGYPYHGGSFDGIGVYGYWQSATEFSNTLVNGVLQVTFFNGDMEQRLGGGKKILCSVRCLQDVIAKEDIYFDVSAKSNFVKMDSIEIVQMRENKIFKTDSGIFSWTYRGEFGGDLYFRHNNIDSLIPIKWGYMIDVFQFREKIYFIEGIAHMLGRNGSLYELDKNAKGFSYKKILDFDKDALVGAATYKDKIFLASYSKIYMVEDSKIKYTIKRKEDEMCLQIDDSEGVCVQFK